MQEGYVSVCEADLLQLCPGEFLSSTEPIWLLQRELTLVWVLLIVTVIVTFFIQRYRITYIPPSGAAMVLGILVGSVMKLSGHPSVNAIYMPLSTYAHAMCRAMTQHLACAPD